MKMGKRILFLVILAVLSGHFAVAQTDSLVRYGDSLHRAYDFAEAESVYLQVLDSLDVVEDSLVVKDVRERLRMSENGKNMSRFVQVPQAAGKRRLPQEAFFLAYPLEDRSWRPLPNVLDADSGHDHVKSLYAPDWNDVLYFSAEGPSGTRDIMMTMLDDTLWTVPVPVAELSDSSADEIYPMLSPDGRTIFFASDGHYGLGGYDLCK